VIDEINRAKPSSAKGRYILSATLTTTMGPGIRLDTGKVKGADGTAVVSSAADPGREAEESADNGPSEEQSQSDSSATSEDTAEEPATA